MSEIKYVRSSGLRVTMYRFDPWDLDSNGLKQVVAWCQSEYGCAGSRWSVNTAQIGRGWGQISFRDEADAFHFLLRWG
jgi:hypothetical protein